jgi:hypothetical protein
VVFGACVTIVGCGLRCDGVTTGCGLRCDGVTTGCGLRCDGAAVGVVFGVTGRSSAQRRWSLEGGPVVKAVQDIVLTFTR